MSDPVNNARNARERLAHALGALQQPGVPPALLGVAEPVAQAMSALHQIEASHGAATAQSAPKALDGVRRALGSLQADASGHPAVVQAIEAVAGSLGMIHALSAAPVAAQPGPAAAFPAAQPAPVRGGLGFAGTIAAEAPGAHPPPTQPSAALRAQQAAHARPAPVHQAPPQAAPAARAPAQHPAPAPAAAVPVAAGNLLRMNAELGVHSATNFYKGLSGNDLFDSGGIFIATYQIPSIGRELLIHVSMPGGYEFDAKGIVRWTREAPLSTAGAEAPPGFGAQFTEISAEGRQLIQRYVRNREPLFHDDL